MRDDARAAVRALEDLTGIPVLVTGDASLTTMATIKPAKVGAPAHILRYHPKFAALADYLIALQCGFALRLSQSPGTAPFELSGTEAGRREAGRLLEEPLNRAGLKLPPVAAEGLRDRLFEGLLAQLRSMPVGLRVDAWIRSEFPGLREQQEAAVRRQAAENQQTLDPEARRIVPEMIGEASLGMNAAFALFWGRTLDHHTLAVPYRVAGHLALGEQLLRIADEIPDGPADGSSQVGASDSASRVGSGSSRSASQVRSERSGLPAPVHRDCVHVIPSCGVAGIVPTASGRVPRRRPRRTPAAVRSPISAPGRRTRSHVTAFMHQLLISGCSGSVNRRRQCATCP